MRLRHRAGEGRSRSHGIRHSRLEHQDEVAQFRFSDPLDGFVAGYPFELALASFLEVLCKFGDGKRIDLHPAWYLHAVFHDLRIAEGAERFRFYRAANASFLESLYGGDLMRQLAGHRPALG